MEYEYSHLNTLIGRELSDRSEKPGNLIGRALNIAEFMVAHKALGATEIEKEIAIEMVVNRGLGYLFEVSEEEFPRYAESVRMSDHPTFCVKCGRPLKNKIAIQTGMGITCRSLTAKDVWETSRKQNATTERRAEIAENDALEMDNPTRLGLRKLATKYQISVSSVRIDRISNRTEKALGKEVDELIDAGHLIPHDTDSVVLPDPLPPVEVKMTKKAKKAAKEAAEEEPHGPFNPEIKCKIYIRKADGSHCKRKCKNSKLPEVDDAKTDPEKVENLCATCEKDFAECATPDDIVYGGEHGDAVVECTEYIEGTELENDDLDVEPDGEVEEEEEENEVEFEDESEE